ncbi:PH domain protein [Teladorsagia circumcincta]|uniref:PH domain protein n=1 Tax=Teladorsagia circumcincta TaxID=45464 RepID=A0A2G9US85_TELCI|nr:PH domain protein [Teladorsagia circumcincta]
MDLKLLLKPSEHIASIKFDCMQTSRRLELSNGKEAKVEEKCERYQGDIKGFRPVEITQNNQKLQLDPNNAQDMAISCVLGQVPDTFMNMLSKEKDNLVKMFPDLFAHMRSQSSLIPASTTEVITNPDGSTTTRVRSSKSYSSHFSKHETFINGVKQMSKSTFKAFVEYKGPEGGYRVKLADNADDLSEEETEDDDRASRIANVVRKQAPFLKMYSEYTNNYERASRIFEELKKKKKFADVVREIEKVPECEGLPLAHHLICPVQRVMRYQLLLQEYKKHLLETDVDYEDTALALQLVLQAASHANEMMKKLDGFGKVIEVQEQLGNSISLVSPGRELLKTGTLQKISSTTEKTEERTIFLFNDLILLAGERKMIGLYKYRLRAVFHACHTQICEGDNLEREHSFYIRGSDGNGPQRCVELFSETQKEKNDWVESICAVIEDCRANSATFGAGVKTTLSETNNNHCESRNCADCDAEFSLFYRGVKCGKCRRKLCKKCFGRYRTESKNNRVCEPCVKNMGFESIRRSASAQSNGRTNVLAVPAQGKGVLHASRVKWADFNVKKMKYNKKRVFGTRYVRCAREPSDDLRTLCSVVAEKITTKPGERCLSDFEPKLKNVRSLCPTMCRYADEYEIVHKVPSNNHICIKYENYGLIKREKDIYLWRRGACLNETIAFTINCGFPFSRKNLDRIQKDPLLYLERLLARH